VGEYSFVWELNRRHIIVLLFLLHVGGEAIKKDIMRALGVENSQYAEKILLDLKELELVSEKRLGKRVRVFSLTEKGRRAAEVLDKLARELWGEPKA